MRKKQYKTTASDRRHFAKVAALGCIVCQNNGYPGTPAEIHHPRFLGCAGKKSGNRDVLPICHFHHRTGGFGNAIHAGIETWEATHGTEAELLEQVKSIMGEE